MNNFIHIVVATYLMVKGRLQRFLVQAWISKTIIFFQERLPKIYVKGDHFYFLTWLGFIYFSWLGMKVYYIIFLRVGNDKMNLSDPHKVIKLFWSLTITLTLCYSIIYARGFSLPFRSVAENYRSAQRYENNLIFKMAMVRSTKIKNLLWQNSMNLPSCGVRPIKHPHLI